MDFKALDQLKITNVRYLPIVREYAKRLNLVDTINSMVDTKMDLQPGPAILAMIMDTLTGRTPLYRLADSFADKDTTLLLGEDIHPSLFSDYNVGRVLDKTFDAGTQKIFSQISQNAVGSFGIATDCGHYDTTSVSVYGAYDSQNPPFKITYGHSKDKRPDLKQFLIEMLCVDRNIPILGATRDGNASDKTLNNELLSNASGYMAKYGLGSGAFIHVADSAFVTEDNLLKAEEQNIKFISRLPATFNECQRVIQQAVAADQWIEIGKMNQTPATEKRPAAIYRAFESTAKINNRTYRAIVVHSSAHDKRRHKRIDRILQQSRKELKAFCKKETAAPFFCKADAQMAIFNIYQAAQKSQYYRVASEITEIPKYGPGRPSDSKPRIPHRYEYMVKTKLFEIATNIEPLRLEAGCFVLLTNLSSPQEVIQWDAQEVLRLYKDQSDIEQNFGFLKDPAIINAIFLKKETRIEVLGLVLLLALLIWRLMERSLRLYVHSGHGCLPGWNNRTTTRPTSFMMSTKFENVLVIASTYQRKLVRSLNAVQLQYLKALNVDPRAFLKT